MSKEKKQAGVHTAAEAGPRGGITKPHHAEGGHGGKQKKIRREFPAKAEGHHETGKTNHEHTTLRAGDKPKPTAASRLAREVSNLQGVPPVAGQPLPEPEV